MSRHYRDYVWAHSPYTGSSFVVHLCLADLANESGESWYSLEKLAARCRVSPRQAQRIIHTMVKAGDIQVCPGKGPGSYSVYRLKHDIRDVFSPRENTTSPAENTSSRGEKHVIQGAAYKEGSHRDPTEIRGSPPQAPPPTLPAPSREIDPPIDPVFPPQPLRDGAREVLLHLKQVTGLDYTRCNVFAVQKYLVERLGEGATAGECCLLIDWWATWREAKRPGTTEAFLDPHTPFKRHLFWRDLPKARKWHAAGRRPPTDHHGLPAGLTREVSVAAGKTMRNIAELLEEERARHA